MPSSTHRFLAKSRKAASDDENLMSNSGIQTIDPAKTEFVDFQVISKIIQVIKITNQIKQTQNMRKPEGDLEHVLLSFASSYKGHVLTDSKLI